MPPSQKPKDIRILNIKINRKGEVKKNDETFEYKKHPKIVYQKLDFYYSDTLYINALFFLGT